MFQEPRFSKGKDEVRIFYSTAYPDKEALYRRRRCRDDSAHVSCSLKTQQAAPALSHVIGKRKEEKKEAMKKSQ